MKNAEDTLPDNAPDNAEDAFPGSYRESRQRLLEAARTLAQTQGCTIDSRPISATGPANEPLAIDFIRFGSAAVRHALVISSGTHGVEGFCGAAIQWRFVTQMLPALNLEEGTAIMLVHAVNPYGFAWLRRVNESNVDLNRNFVADFGSMGVSADYEALFPALNPPDLDPDREPARWEALAHFSAAHGARRLQQAIAEGQYRHPRGMQFGGHGPEASRRHLLEWIDATLSTANDVLWVDFHTGLGESGDCELITTAAPGTDAWSRATAVWPEVRSASPSADQSVSTPLHGLMEEGVARSLPAGCRFAMVAPEFGTHPIQRVVAAMRADNWLHAHGRIEQMADPLAHPIKAEILEAFRPDSAAWRQRVLATGLDVLRRACDALPGVSRLARA